MNRDYYEDYDCTPMFKCNECGELCKVIEETFDYSGTHCTNGNGGTHRTGHYASDCCDAGYEEV